MIKHNRDSPLIPNTHLEVRYQPLDQFMLCRNRDLGRSVNAHANSDASVVIKNRILCGLSYVFSCRRASLELQRALLHIPKTWCHKLRRFVDRLTFFLQACKFGAAACSPPLRRQQQQLRWVNCTEMRVGLGTNINGCVCLCVCVCVCVCVWECTKSVRVC